MHPGGKLLIGRRIWRPGRGDGVIVFHEDHDFATSPRKRDACQVERGLRLNVVFREGALVLQVLACKVEVEMVGRDRFIVVHPTFDRSNSVSGLDIQGDELTGQEQNEKLSFNIGMI